jgi:hypothetical protein
MGMNPRLLRPTESGFDPRRIAGLALWLDASDSATLFDATTGGSVVAAGGAVGRWEDKSGNGRHATQGTANNRPQRSAASVNGRDAVLFDGSNDFFTTTSFALSQPITALAVVRPTSIGFAAIVDGSQSGTRVQFGVLSDGRMRMFAGAIFDTNAVAFSQNTTTLAGGIYNSTSSQHRVNSAVLSSGNASPGTNGLSAGANIAAANDGGTPFPGRICEIVYYSGVLNSASLSAVETYLMRKWGIA